MKIYFDESYPFGKHKLILGGMFVSESKNEALKKKINKIKRMHGITKEIKYTEIYSRNKLEAAKEIVEAYLHFKSPFFKACIVPYSSADLLRFPGTDLGDKRVAVYVDSARKLIIPNIPANQIVTIFPDEETRIAQTKLYAKLKKAKLRNGVTIKEVTPVKSSTKSVMQLCDLLTGAVLQNLYPSTGKTGAFKKEFGEFVKNRLGISDFLKNSNHVKLSVHHWKVPNSFSMRDIKK